MKKLLCAIIFLTMTAQAATVGIIPGTNSQPTLILGPSKTPLLIPVAGVDVSNNLVPLLVNADGSLQVTGGGGGGGGTACATGTKTPGLLVATTSSSVGAGAISVSFLNTGAAAVTVLGVSMAQGEFVSYEAPCGATLVAISYNATGGTLKISEVR